MKLTTQHVVVIGMVLAAIVALSIAGRDTSAIVGLGVAILAGLGLVVGQQLGIGGQVNGRFSTMLSMIEKQGHMLAAMQPTPAIEATVITSQDHTPANDQPLT